MFLHQRFDYEYKVVTDEDERSVVHDFLNDRADFTAPMYIGFDTETTGLNVKTDTPFLVAFGWKSPKKRVYVFNCVHNPKMLDALMFIMRQSTKVYAHNVQFDVHMMINFGVDVSEVDFADSMTVARLTQYADSMSRLSLESLGVQYVSDDAKMSGKVIKTRITEMKRAEQRRIREMFEREYPNKAFSHFFNAWLTRVKHIPVSEDEEEIFDYFDENYLEPNYESAYWENKELVENYAADDVVIMLEFLDVALPTLDMVDPTHRTFERENALLPITLDLERTGIKANVRYLIDAHKRVSKYRNDLYAFLRDTAGSRFTVSQHAVIKQVFQDKYGITLESCDEKALEKVIKEHPSTQASFVAEVIIKLRTVDKWLGTYIEGELNAIHEGRVYPSINSNGTVSGRISSNMQQQPKDPLLDTAGHELFHPRRVFEPDPGCALVFFDFSQMELRYQAYYTMLISGGDTNMCRAYIPFKCVSDITGETFDYKDPTHIDRWDSGEWLDETGKPWEAVDLHNVTTFLAFPHLNNDPTHPEFKKLRKLGKMCNFLKNYQGSVMAIYDQMDVDWETANRLNDAYYKAFPLIKDYQNWVTRELALHGYVESLYDRRFYMQDAKWFYKASNYLIQGGCAYLVKEKEIEISNMLTLGNFKTKFVLPVHDEMVFNVPLDELETVIPLIKERMEDTKDKLPWMPMICEVEWTTTNWAEKKPWKEN